MKRKFTLMANNSTNRTTTSHLKKFKKKYHDIWSWTYRL